MLSVLRVRNFAIIDELEVEFGPGLNVVTGETGAGKSILIHALELVLGAPSRSEVVRTGEDRAEVEALFEIGSDEVLQGLLSAAGMDADGELIVRRVVHARGRSRAYINGSLTPLKKLREFAPHLADISSQHLAHSLVDPRTHLRFLDAFAELAPTLVRMEEAFGSFRRAEEAQKIAKESSRDRFEREDLLRFQLQEIDDIDPQPGERDRLNNELSRLSNAETLRESAASAEWSLQANENSICDQLSRLETSLTKAGELDAALLAPASMIGEARTNLEEAARDLGNYERSVEVDAEALSRTENRREGLRRLLRKYGGTVEATLLHRERAALELDELTNHEQRLEDATRLLEIERERAETIAEELSSARRAAASDLGTSICEQLRSLGMGEAEVRVEVRGTDTKGQDATGLTPRGRDKAEFLIAPNRGEAARPLGRIASGGELSRAMLAVKRVLGRLGPGGLYAFDEVDTGVGGAVAEVIGRKLQEVAGHRQVLCITHLPQIAVYGTTHFQVVKAVSQGRTRSLISQLDAKDRAEEIARMLGGITISEQTRAAAQEMLAVATPGGS